MWYARRAHVYEKRVSKNEKVNYSGKTSSLKLINALRNLFNIIYYFAGCCVARSRVDFARETHISTAVPFQFSAAAPTEI